MDNQEGFIEAFGSAFDVHAPGSVTAKELHSLAHDREAGVLEDTTLLGDTAVCNRTVIGEQRDVVGPDGSLMRVSARWDGDVWVEVDDALVLETRRWREGEYLVVARTVARDDGTLVTSKAFMGKPLRKAPAFEAPDNTERALSGHTGQRSGRTKSKSRSKRSKRERESERAEREMDEDAEDGDDAESVYSAVEKAVETVATGFLGGLFGGGSGSGSVGEPKAASSKEASAASARVRGAAKPAAAAKFFGIPTSAPFCGVFPCSLRNHLGHVYVFEFHVGFAALNLAEHAKWSAPAKLVNNLEITGRDSLAVGLVTGLNLTLEGVDDRDAVYECMVSMLEKIPPSPGEEVHGEPDFRVAAPLRLGFHPERYVFVHVARATSLPEAASGSVAIVTAALGRYGAAVTARGPTLANQPTRFGRTLAFPAAEADLSAESVMLAVAGGGLGDDGYGATTLGEARVPLAMLPRTRTGAEEVKEKPFTVRLAPPGNLGEGSTSFDEEGAPGEEASASDLAGTTRRSKSPSLASKRRRAITIGELSVVAWIGTTSELYELGDAATLAVPSAESQSTESAVGFASTRVPPAVSRVTVNVHRVRGVVAAPAPRGLKSILEDVAEMITGEDEDEGETAVDIKCRLTVGDQTSATAPAKHAPSAQAAWGPSTRQFVAVEPRGGAMTVDVVGPDDKTVLGRVEVDISTLPMRPRKGAFARAHWLKLRRPPAEDDASSRGSSRRGSRRGSGSRAEDGEERWEGGFFIGIGGVGFRIGGRAVAAAAPSSAHSDDESESDDETDSEWGTDAESSMNGDGGEDDEYLGEILLDAFVDEGCGPSAAIGKRPPLGELSIEILSMRGITPDGKSRKAEPSVMVKIGGSWAHLPAQVGAAPPAWRREIVAAVYDPADCAEIGVFDKPETSGRNAGKGEVPLGFVNVPVRRLPRGAWIVSTLALSGGADANPVAEMTIKAKYTPRASAAAHLMSYFAPPLPRSAYLYGQKTGAPDAAASVEALIAQQRAHAESSLLEGPAPLPRAMVGAMLPRGAKIRRGDALGSAKSVKACVVRVAAALDPFRGELEALGAALSWESPALAGALHVALVFFAYHPRWIFPALLLWLATHTARGAKPGRWTLVGADKSARSGSFDVGEAPPGSKLAGAETAAALGPDAPSELAREDAHSFKGDAHGPAGVSAASRALGVHPSAETYEACVQFAYWAQATARRFAPAFEALEEVMARKDQATTHAFAAACFGAAFVMLFVKLNVLLLVAAFVALRHPIVWKPATLPYRLALAAEER